MHNEKKTLTTLLQLLSTSAINLQGFPDRLQKKQITSEDSAYLSRLGACLTSLFGASSRFQSETDNQTNLLSSFEAELKKYEAHISGDTLAARFQPHVDAMLYSVTQAEKDRLLKNIEAICEVLADHEIIAQLSLIWGYIQAVEVENDTRRKTSTGYADTTDIKTKVDALQPTFKNKAYQYLIVYKNHLYRELKQAWPYEYATATTKEGRVFILNAEGQSIKESRMQPDFRLLIQKCRAINEAIILVKAKQVSFSQFITHFETNTQPIIERIRAPFDNAFLNFMARLFTHPVGLFSKSYATQGGKVAKSIEKMSAAPARQKSLLYIK